LDEILRRIVAALQPERVCPFGSPARGQAGSDIDHDLRVVVSETDQPTHRLSQQAHSAPWGLGVSADILGWACRAFGERLGVVASLPALVTREGRLLCAA
jgi:predicted nucleotidyltransferase